MKPMPRYVKDINYIVQTRDVAAMMERATSPRNQALHAFFYLTGARPIEVCQVTREDVKQTENGGLEVTIKTAKLGAVKGFKVRERTLPLPHGAPFLSILRGYWETRPENSLLFDLQPDTMKKIVYRDSDNLLCPYHFRHSRMYKLAQGGASLADLQNWKGAVDIRSVSAYLAAKKVTERRLD